MRRLLPLLCMFLSLHCWAQEHAALLMVHYGTTSAEAQRLSIDALNQRARQQFPTLEVREAWLSPVVVSRLAAKGIKKQNAIEALLRLRADGYTSVRVLPSFVIDGLEMAQLRRDVDQLRPFFDTISVSTPLLYTVQDCQRLCTILAQRHPADAKKRHHVVFVGHGTEGPATALYSQLDHMLHAQGHPLHHVATIEGYPTLQTLIQELRAQRAKAITLVPRLFVAGNHATKDISGAWKEALEAEGLAVSVVLEGLGQVPEVQQMYIGK